MNYKRNVLCGNLHRGSEIKLLKPKHHSEVQKATIILHVELHSYFLIPPLSSKDPKGDIKENFMKRKRNTDI